VGIGGGVAAAVVLAVVIGVVASSSGTAAIQADVPDVRVRGSDD
jgi:hypothetical protein